ncbi:N-acetyl-beta-hexosaminidase [Bombiscardovia nodaiensis]|uniref:beta-N-acetylhexosaminidase n=1 Tax=Bombiscardovia nodaiensis TaxID=2932181 RepID=A0ABM8B8M8_9BIFI|nr:N-acetyl-beta-hexosaminidase [Bombiscardovia nodaiensis]
MTTPTDQRQTPTPHATPDPGAEQLALIPIPQQVSMESGHRLMPANGRISYRGPRAVDHMGRISFLSAQLAQEIREQTGLTWSSAQGARWSAWIELNIDPSLSPQAYKLRIKQGSPAVSVCGGDWEGLRYGVQTLRQIIRQRGALLPCLQIEDQPVMPVRSYSLDVTRGRVPTMAWLKAWVDKLAFYKYNQLQLYVEHTFGFDGLSESWRGTSPLQPQDILELDTYCLQQGIELVPSLSTFGHHYMTLRTRSWRALGEFPEQADRPYSFIERQEHHTLNVTDPKAFEFSCSIIDSYAQLFSSRKFNIGGDETFDLGKGQSKQRAQEVGADKLYADYLVSLCDHLTEQGREPMFWGDIAVSMPGVLDRLPKDFPLLNWLYAPDIDDSKVKLVAQTGLPQYVCSAVQAWNGLLPKVHDAWSNISRLDRFGQQYAAVGAMVTDWGDYGHINDPVMSIPGLVYGAQYAWQPDGPDFDQMNVLISRLEYGDQSGRYLDALSRASQAVSFGWNDMVTYAELNNGQGQVNTDVSDFLASVHGSTAWPTQATTPLAQARKHYLELCLQHLQETRATNDLLLQASADLARAAASSTRPGYENSHAQLLACQGQFLFNELGLSLAQRAGLVTSAEAESAPKPTELAGQLESWFEQYRARWRQTSRESELRRISAVVWAFADLLRQ